MNSGFIFFQACAKPKRSVDSLVDAGGAPLLIVRSIGHTDVGRVREHNEDAYAVNDELGLYVVADGMGGAAAGEVASAEAVDTVSGMVRNGREKIQAFNNNPSEENRFAVRRMLESALQAATYMVFGMAAQDPSQKGMGTTISALLIANDQAFIAQVGDSRVYVMRGGRCVQVTQDHTLVNLHVSMGILTPEQAKTAKNRNLVTRAVGVREYVQVDTFDLKCQSEDAFLLCSDGLHDYYKDEKEILETIGVGEKNLMAAAKRLIAKANERGGRDNITSVLVALEEFPD